MAASPEQLLKEIAQLQALYADDSKSATAAESAEKSWLLKSAKSAWLSYKKHQLVVNIAAMLILAGALMPVFLLGAAGGFSPVAAIACSAFASITSLLLLYAVAKVCQCIIFPIIKCCVLKPLAACWNRYAKRRQLRKVWDQLEAFTEASISLKDAKETIQGNGSADEATLRAYHQIQQAVKSNPAMATDIKDKDRKHNYLAKGELRKAVYARYVLSNKTSIGNVETELNLSGGVGSPMRAYGYMRNIAENVVQQSEKSKKPVPAEIAAAACWQPKPRQTT